MARHIAAIRTVGIGLLLSAGQIALAGDVFGCADVATEAASSSIDSIAVPTAADQETLTVGFASTIRNRALDTLADSGIDFSLTGTVTIAPEQTLSTSEGRSAVLAITTSGRVYRVDPTTQLQDWVRDLRRPTCSADSLGAATVVRRADASADFQEAFPTDVALVGTRYSCSTGREDNRIYAINLATAQTLWTFNNQATEDVDVVIGMAVDPASDALYVATDRTASSSQDSLFAIDVLSGTKRWSASLGQLVGKPVIRQGRVYVNDVSGMVFAMDATSGEEIWRHTLVPTTSGVVHGALLPAGIGMNGDLLLVWDFSGRLYAVRDTGPSAASAWDRTLPPRSGAASVPTPGLPVRRTPFVFSPDGARVFAAGDQGSVYEVDAASGDLLEERMIDDVDVAITSINAYTPSELNTNDSNVQRVIAGSADGTLTRMCAPDPTDSDNDGVPDQFDNCTLIANPDQFDANDDGFGSACDTDLNDDGVINAIDLGILRLVFFQPAAIADFNGDGQVNAIDLGVMKASFFGMPGPSGLAP